MTRTNQMSVDDDCDEYTCVSCDSRSFVSEHSILQHCRSGIHHDEWCERCEWLFVSPGAREKHFQDSLRHWVCQTCDFDGVNRQDLTTHQAKAHSYCYDCERNFANHQKHRVEVHHQCRECGKEFNDQNELIMHRQVHLPRDKECHGCRRKFATDSAIMIHLESNTCECGVERDDLDRWAFECYQYDHYTNRWSDDYRYQCPICSTEFTYLSGLFQHVESPACSGGYNASIGKLKHYLMKQTDKFSIGSDSGSADSSGHQYVRLESM